jgi:hypothetical protein
MSVRSSHRNSRSIDLSLVPQQPGVGLAPPRAPIGNPLLGRFVLGAITDELAMILLAIPIISPVVVQFGFDRSGSA